MKISKIEINNYKKIQELSVNIPKNNRVICFVGENGSNKSSVISFLYKLVRSTTVMTSPSDEIDVFNESTLDISQDSKEQYYNFALKLSNGKKNILSSSAAVGNYESLTNETINKLKPIYGAEFNRKDVFLKRGLAAPFFNNGIDMVENSVLLFRPSNRFEISSFEEEKNGNSNWVMEKNYIGQRRFPYRVQSGIKQASSYFLDVILDYFVAKNSQTPSFNIHSYFTEILRSIDTDFAKVIVKPFPNKGIASKNLPSLSSLSAGQSDWFVTAINIVVQLSELASRNGVVYKDVRDISGIVFIDEVDKNYHPKLQETIIPWFLEYFPNIQFIISTHSPYLIRSLDDSSIVIRLPDGEEINDDFTYWDINEISSRVFDRNLGFSERVRKYLKAFKEALRNNEHERSIELYNEMVGKSESLDQELIKVVYTLGSSRLIEVLFNEES